MALTSHSLFIFPLLVCLTYYLEISIVILCGEGKRSEKLTPFTSINLLHGWKVFIHYPHRCIIIRPTKLYFSIWEFFYLIKHSKCYWKFYQQLISSSNGFSFFIKSPHPLPFFFYHFLFPWSQRFFLTCYIEILRSSMTQRCWSWLYPRRVGTEINR